jgi:hypothetical protein
MVNESKALSEGSEPRAAKSSKEVPSLDSEKHESDKKEVAAPSAPALKKTKKAAAGRPKAAKTTPSKPKVVSDIPEEERIKRKQQNELRKLGVKITTPPASPPPEQENTNTEFVDGQMTAESTPQKSGSQQNQMTAQMQK